MKGHTEENDENKNNSTAPEAADTKSTDSLNIADNSTEIKEEITANKNASDNAERNINNNKTITDWTFDSSEAITYEPVS